MVDFFDITFNLNNGTYNPYKKPNNPLLYINKSCNHQPQMIYQLRRIYTDRLSRNSSNNEVFNASKREYEEALNVVVIVSLVSRSSNQAKVSSIKYSYLAHFPTQSPLLHPGKKLYCRKWNFLALTLKNFLYVVKKAFHFRKWNPALYTPSPKNKRNPPWENFFYFRKRKPQINKQKSLLWRNFLLLEPSTETFIKTRMGDLKSNLASRGNRKRESFGDM